MPKVCSYCGGRLAVYHSHVDPGASVKVRRLKCLACKKTLKHIVKMA